MKKLTKKWQMVIYACSAFGVNLLNTIMGSYLCSALLAGGFAESAKPFQTYTGNDLVIVGVWSIMVLLSKILDGIIDIPMASFTDRLRTRWGRRRPALLIGLIPMILAFIMFLFIPQNGATFFNTVYYGIVLCIFYSFYTLTMVTYYATFTEIVETQKDRDFISNVKSVCDIVYFIVGYVAVAAMLKGMNIRIATFIVLPIVLTMLIPLFMIKEPSTLEKDKTDSVSGEKPAAKRLNLFTSLAATFKNRSFILWMVVYMFLNFSSQLFLSGINEYFSFVGMSMINVMIAAFIPVPFTLMIYNKIQKRFGFGVAIRYTLATFGVAMTLMFCVGMFVTPGTFKNIAAIATGLFSSLAIGSIFSVAYSVPSELAAQESEKSGVSNSAMYFAVQGLFSGVATGLGAGPVLNALKGAESSNSSAIKYMTLISGIAAFVGIIFTFFLPRAMKLLGKENKAKEVKTEK